MQTYVYFYRRITRIQNDLLSSVRIKVHLVILTILAFRRHLYIYFLFYLLFSFSSNCSFFFPPLVYPSHFYASHRARFFLNFFASVSLFNYFSLSSSARILSLCFPLSLPVLLFLSALFSDPPFPWTLVPLRIPLIYRGVRSQRTMKHSTLASIS